MGPLWSHLLQHRLWFHKTWHVTCQCTWTIRQILQLLFVTHLNVSLWNITSVAIRCSLLMPSIDVHTLRRKITVSSWIRKSLLCWFCCESLFGLFLNLYLDYWKSVYCLIYVDFLYIRLTPKQTSFHVLL